MKRIFPKIATFAMASLLVLSAVQVQAEEKRVALVAKALGISFFDAAYRGAKEAANEIGDVKIIYTGPADTTASGQIEVVNSLIAQHVDAIAISANDPDALTPVLKKAQQRGIRVVSWDSGVAKQGREIHVSDANDELIGRTCNQLAAEAIKFKGKDIGTFAILSSSSTSTNQNIWIEWMKRSLKDYPNLKLADTAYGDDLADKSFREAKALMKKHPDLDVIVSPTTVGILAAAQAVNDMGLKGKVYVTGIGLPSQLAGHVHSGVINSFAIWNPIDLGYATVMVAHDLITGNGSRGERPIGRMGTLKIDEDGNADMGKPFIYDTSNVDKFSPLF